MHIPPARLGVSDTPCTTYTQQTDTANHSASCVCQRCHSRLSGLPAAPHPQHATTPPGRWTDLATGNSKAQHMQGLSSFGCGQVEGILGKQHPRFVSAENATLATVVTVYCLCQPGLQAWSWMQATEWNTAQRVDEPLVCDIAAATSWPPMGQGMVELAHCVIPT